MYTSLIIEVTGCSQSDANEVEQLMRNEYSTLDHLSRSKFIKCAKSCWDAVKWMRTDEGKKYIASLQF